MKKFFILVNIMFLLISCGSDRANTDKASVVADISEIILDSDGDGIPDSIDADVNGDGVLDNGTDSDGDEIIDIADADINGDGTIDNGIDSDGDGINNTYDPDDDNDGLADAVDANDKNSDSDGDGILDGADADVNGDGINDNADSDSDGDGTMDNGVDSDGDGVNDKHDPVDNSSDADNDGLPDALDSNDSNSDIDGDGILDGADVDIDGDGVIDNGADNDGDGINDLHDEDDDNDGVPDTIDPNRTNSDTDGDGIPDGSDADMDGDGVLDNGTDSDGDGINDISEEHLGTNPLSKDSDGDGINDANEGLLDSDGDGIIDALESNTLDNDNDGVVDQVDSENRNPNNDSDGDGQVNIKELECAEEGDPLDKTKQCPWVTDTKEGKALIASNFVYVPGGFDVDNDQVNEKGFWTSAYQARAKGVSIEQEAIIRAVGKYQTYIDTNFNVLNSESHVRGYRNEFLTDTLKGEYLSLSEDDALNKPRISSLSAYLALVSLNKYKLRDENNKIINKTFGFLTHKQYIQIKLLLEADLESGGDGKTLKNNLLGVDINIPKVNYSIKIYEFGENYKEYMNELAWLFDRDKNVKFTLDQVELWWNIDIDKLEYHHLSNYGASSMLDVGMGTGTYKDRYAVVVRGGSIMDLTLGTTGAESDNEHRTNGVGFRAATPY